MSPKKFFLSLHSVCFFLFHIFYLHSLSFLLLLPSPPFPFPTQHPANDDAANGDDVHDKVDGRPVVDGVWGLQQHEAHAHVVVGPHLQEPVNPVEDVLAAGTQFSSDRGLHGRLGCDAQGDGEEGEVVASVDSMPVGADEHGPASPESHTQTGEMLSYTCTCCFEEFLS